MSDRAVRNASTTGRFLVPTRRQASVTGQPDHKELGVPLLSVKGRERYMGLGPFPDVSLADARAAANECRKLRREGIDPIDHRAGQRAEALLAAPATKTFRECATTYIESKKSGRKNAKHAEQWSTTLETCAHPIIGDLPVQSVYMGRVEKVLKPIWTSKTETASRMRGRIEAVLDWATVQRYRKGENPARWRGHLDKLLPAPSKIRKVKHHPALRRAPGTPGGATTARGHCRPSPRIHDPDHRQDQRNHRGSLG